MSAPFLRGRSIRVAWRVALGHHVRSRLLELADRVVAQVQALAMRLRPLERREARDVANAREIGLAIRPSRDVVAGRHRQCDGEKRADRDVLDCHGCSTSGANRRMAATLSGVRQAAAPGFRSGEQASVPGPKSQAVGSCRMSSGWAVPREVGRLPCPRPRACSVEVTGHDPLPLAGVFHHPQLRRLSLAHVHCLRTPVREPAPRLHVHR